MTDDGLHARAMVRGLLFGAALVAMGALLVLVVGPCAVARLLP